MYFCRYNYIIILLAFVAVAGKSQAFELGMPLICDYGTECFIQSYVDVDPSDEWQDYNCNALTYGGHKGTDFRLRDLVDMQKGYEVQAAAAGTVKGMRNGMADISIKDAEPSAVEGKECGNGVVLTHEDGWETQYCHMKQGSIRVKEGQKLAKGQLIGMVGLSGNTEFPHLHISVRKDGNIVDPFKGGAHIEGCKKSGNPLWDKETQATLDYITPGILNLYFTTRVPNSKEAREGKFREVLFPAKASAMVVWADMFGIWKDDVYHMRIIAPDGKIIAESLDGFPKNQAQYFQYIGKELTQEAWPSGIYKAEIVLLRKGKMVASKHINIQVQ